MRRGGDADFGPLVAIGLIVIVPFNSFLRRNRLMIVRALDGGCGIHDKNDLVTKQR